MKHFDIISIFPQSLDSYFDSSILARARDKKLIKITTHDLRKYTTDKHHKVDDKPYGGGAGMVVKVEPVYNALKKLKALNVKFQNPNVKSIPNSQPVKGHVGPHGSSTGFLIPKKTRIILLAANGKQFMQADAKRLAKYDRLVFICGHYEGVDARAEEFIDEKFSIGPYVVTGGELPAAIIIDAVSRMVKGVVGKEESVQNESYSKSSRNSVQGTVKQKNNLDSKFQTPDSYLEHPHYTRPEVFRAGKRTLKVPKVLLSGNHKNIELWRVKNSKNS